LTADAFSEATEGQLKALARWVKGGGSVCVFVGAGLQAHHLWFLNELADSVSSGPTFLSDDKGYLVPGQKKISHLYSGMGRSVIVTGTVGTEITLNSPDWRRAVAFLWKFRETRVQAITETAHWENNVTNESGDVPPITIEEYAAQAQLSRRPNWPITATNSLQSIPGSNAAGSNYTAAALLAAQTKMLQFIDQAVALTDAEKARMKTVLGEYYEIVQQARGGTISERRNKLMVARQALDASIKGILTPDQYAKYQAMPRRPRPTFNYGAFSANPYEVQPSMLASELMAPLLPKTVRLIPFSALLGILAVFLLAIGPGDYFMLGSLRRRRYTWILFPALSFCFMLATVVMANHFLGSRDQRRSLFIVDLDKDGTALRWNRYDVIFAAADKLAVTELKDALWVPLNSSPVPGMQYPYNPGGMPPGAPTRMPAGTYVRNGRIRYRINTYGSPTYGEMETGPSLYEGIVPTHFQTSQLIRQWQPRLNRVFSFEPPPVPLIPNWREVEAAWPDLPAVRAKLSSRKRFEGDVCAISHSGLHSLNGAINTPTALYPQMFQYQTTFDPDSSQILPPSILSELCLGGSDGLRSVVSQISPNGGGSSEDVPGMDTDAGDSTLVIVTQSGDDIIVYRRFFHGS